LKRERWGSPLVQEKYREEKACDKRHPYRIIIIIIIIIATTGTVMKTTITMMTITIMHCWCEPLSLLSTFIKLSNLISKYRCISYTVAVCCMIEVLLYVSVIYSNILYSARYL